MAFGAIQQAPAAIALTVSVLSAGVAGTTEVTALSASVSGRTVSATGSASFGEAPVVVGEDPANDNGGGPATGTAGLDIRRLLISQPDGSAPTLLFTIELAGLTGGGMPESIQYNWDIAVDGGAEAGGTSWSIKSSRSSQYYQAGSISPYAGVFSCTRNPAGVYGCELQSSVGAVYDPAAGQIRIAVPISAIQAEPGAKITAWTRNAAPVWVQPAVAGAVTPGVTVDEATHGIYTIPDRSVRLGLAPPGTPEENVSYTRTASVHPDGTFTGTITAPSSGSYDLWAKACLGATCGTRSRRITTT